MDTEQINSPVGIVLIAHCNLAVELLNAVEYVLGLKLDNTTAISVEIDSDIVCKQKEVIDAVTDVDRGAGVVIVTDIHGSTPSNLALRAAAPDENIRVLCGANLPLVIKLVQSRFLPLKDIEQLALNSGRQYVHSLS